LKDEKEKKEPKFPVQERLSQRELEWLMGVKRDRFERKNGKIRRK
jgi:hypothetical protein